MPQKKSQVRYAVVEHWAGKRGEEMTGFYEFVTRAEARAAARQFREQGGKKTMAIKFEEIR